MCYGRLLQYGEAVRYEKGISMFFFFFLARVYSCSERKGQKNLIFWAIYPFITNDCCTTVEIPHS